MSSTYHVIGLMSGTSLDGLDIAFCEFQYSNHWQYKIIECTTIAYPEDLEKKLSHCIDLNGYELVCLDHELGKYIGRQVNSFLKNKGLTPHFISSHGHTVFHQPGKGFTLQIGNLHQVYAATRVPVVGDFRTLDVALGGQGAPLVPIGDKLLFGNYDYCLNLGGIANISYDINGKRVAFDICPNNLALNHLARKEGLNYDYGGKLAEKGSFNDLLFKKLNEGEYFNRSIPKSLGIEWVNENVFPLLDESSLPIHDVLHTYCHHIALQISQCIDQKKEASLLITGGGALNRFLIKTIGDYCGENVKVVLPDKNIIEYKEALVFAFLGVLRWRNEINILKSVTGASEDSVSGTVISAKKV